MNPLRKGINNFFRDINFLIVLISLSLSYVVGVGITFILAKIFRKSFLGLSKKEDYWEPLNLKENKMEEYYKQY